MCTKLYVNCKKFYQKMLFLCIIFIISDTRADIYYKSFILHLNRTQTSEAHFFFMKVFSRIDFPIYKDTDHEEYTSKSLGEF